MAHKDIPQKMNIIELTRLSNMFVVNQYIKDKVKIGTNEMDKQFKIIGQNQVIMNFIYRMMVKINGPTIANISVLNFYLQVASDDIKKLNKLEQRNLLIEMEKIVMEAERELIERLEKKLPKKLKEKQERMYG